jgi:hypothetical protein
MDQVSRPVQILLLVTLLFAAVWFVALRPKPAGGESAASAPAPAAQTTTSAASGAAPGTAGLKRAIDQAHDAVTTASGDAQRVASSGADGAGGAGASSGTASGAQASAGAADAATGGAKAHAHRAAAAHGKAGGAQVRAVKAALRRHKAVAIAFVDPKTADARAVAGEMHHVSRFGGRAVVLAVPLAKLSAYAFITKAVEVTVAPPVVIVDRRGRATTIVGYADRGEIEQRLADALAVKRR